MEHDVVFVIMWYNSAAEQKIINLNNGNKTEITQKLLGIDNVVFTQIDMGIKEHDSGDSHDADYSVLYQIINGKKYAEDAKDYLLK